MSETSVSAYLQFLSDPSSVLDEAMVRKLERNIEKAKDPIERLRALGALERAQTPDGGAFEAAFVRDAKAWADAEGIPAGAFRTMGVPEEVLVRAGLVKRERRGGRAAKVAKRQFTPIAVIQEWVLAQPGRFTLADVRTNLGGSPATIKKALDDLVASGKVHNHGSLDKKAGRGRTPYVYSVGR